jgi:CheY-like chemotaxis protein
MQRLMMELGSVTTSLAASQTQAVGEALDHRPDLIAADVILAEGSGPGAVCEIKSHLGEIPVIYITAYPDQLREIDRVSPLIEKPVRWLPLVRATSAFGLPPHDFIDLDH